MDASTSKWRQRWMIHAMEGSQGRAPEPRASTLPSTASVFDAEGALRRAMEEAVEVRLRAEAPDK